MEKSLVVQGKSLDEAMDKAATLLHCPKERIAYEILQEPRPGRYGQPGVLCKLRVTPVSLAAEELDTDEVCRAGGGGETALGRVGPGGDAKRRVPAVPAKPGRAGPPHGAVR